MYLRKNRLIIGWILRVNVVMRLNALVALCLSQPTCQNHLCTHMAARIVLVLTEKRIFVEKGQTMKNSTKIVLKVLGWIVGIAVLLALGYLGLLIYAFKSFVVF